MELLRDFFLAFVPLFVAIDALGALPLFVHLTDGTTRERRLNLVTQATLTAGAIAIVFIFAGKLIFSLLGITDNDFRVAGGIVLLVISISDLAYVSYRRSTPSDLVGVVPIGIPLIMGPAALTTILVSLESNGFALTVASLALNLAIVWITFRNYHWIIRALGEAGSRAFAKVMSLFMAAIAVMMIRMGLSGILGF